MWVPHELTDNQKNHHFEVSSSLTLLSNNEPFLDWIIICDGKWILYNQQWPAQWLAPKTVNAIAGIGQQKGLNSSPWQYQNTCYTTTLQKLDKLGYKVLLHPPYSPEWVSKSHSVVFNSLQLHGLLHGILQARILARVAFSKGSSKPRIKPMSPALQADSLPTEPHMTSCQMTITSSSILDSLMQGKHFHNQQEEKNDFQEFVKSWNTDFYATRINQGISHWQKCVDCNGSYFD